MRLALATAARATEIAGARKAEFENLDNPKLAVWIIPNERAKSKTQHLIPLSRLALEMVKAAIELTSENDEFVFPLRRGHRRASIDRHALASSMRCFSESLKGPIAKSWQQEPPTPHDLRRTLNSRLAQMGIPKEVRSAALGHVPRRSDVEARHYLVHEFEKEKREAFSRWAAEIEGIIKPAAVVPIRNAKGRR